jgi:hypothetical protein
MKEEPLLAVIQSIAAVKQHLLSLHPYTNVSFLYTWHLLHE